MLPPSAPCPPLYLHLPLPNSSPPPRSSSPHISLLLPSLAVTLLLLPSASSPTSLLLPSASSPTSLFPSPSPTPLAPTAQFTYNQYLSQKFSWGEVKGLRYIFSILVMTVRG